MNISDAFINVLLADATYALGSGVTNGMTGDALSDHTELKKRMTPLSPNISATTSQ